MKRVSWILGLLSSVCLLAEVPPEVQRQYACLKAVLAEADEAYFVHHESIMSDDAYDHIKGYFASLVEAYPELAADGGGDVEPAEARQRVAHDAPVLSLKKAYTDDDVEAFARDVKDPSGYLIEPKIDGVSLVFNYRRGRLVEALTRGNGESGIDVTAAVMASGCLPLELPGAPPELRLRGEVYLTKETFRLINERREAAGEERLQTERNTAAGSLMLTDYNRVRGRGLELLVFAHLNAEENGFSNEREALASVAALGLPVVEAVFVEDGADLVTAVARARSRWKDLPYRTDGLVIKANTLGVRKELGHTKRYPRWALARKYRSEPVVTVVEAIEWSVSEKGKRTPVAVLQPVEIGGAVVSRASLHNKRFMEGLGVKAGSRVEVIRAGGVIPEIVGVLEPGKED